jgi:hypothetical protein
MRGECFTRTVSVNRSLIRAIVLGTVALLLLEGAAHGQTAVRTQTTWGGFGREAPSGAAVAVDGSTYITGTTDSFTTDQFGNPSPSIFLVKLTPNGLVDWQRVWTGPTVFGTFHGPTVALSPGPLPGSASDDSVYVTGLTVNNGTDAVLLKFDAFGNLLWQRTWGGGGGEESQAVAATPDGFVYIAGQSTSFGASGSSLFVVKFDSAGALVWQKVWDGSSGFEAVAVAPDGSVYAAGTTPRDATFSQFSLVAIRVTPGGSLVWQRTYAAGDIADARGGMTVAPDGSIYFAGAIQAMKGNTPSIAPLLVRLAPAGTLLFDGQWSAGDTAAGVAAAADNSVYVAGTISGSGAGGQDAFVFHLLPSGKIGGAATWGGTGFDEGGGVALAADGTISLAAIAEAPPYSLIAASKRLTNVKGTVSAAVHAFGDAAGTVSDPAAAVIIPNGSPTFAGNVDAALVRIVP